MREKTCGNCKRYRPLGKSCDIHLSIRDIEKDNRACQFFDALPKMTNGDKLRMMSNEELAHRFAYPCPPGKVTQCTGTSNEECKECWLEWLNSEVAE